jgi:uncharacterized membrane protein YkoI
MLARRYARTGVLLLAATATFGLAACSGGGNDQAGAGGPASTGPAGSASSSASSQPRASSASPGGTGHARQLVAAGRTAVHAVPKGTLISIETERNGTAWEAQVVTPDGTEHELNVSAGGTKVLSGPSTKHEGKKDKTKHRDRIKAAELDYEQAAQKVLSAVPNAVKITELDLDTHHGSTVWEADVYDRSHTEHEVTIDAATGKTVANETG